MQQTKSLILESLLPRQTLASLVDHSSVIRSGAISSLNLNVYGTAEVSDEVAIELSRNGLFLQDPDCVIEGTHYLNPQYLELPVSGISSSTGVDTSDATKDDCHNRLACNEDLLYMQDTIDLDFGRLLDRLAHHESLIQATVDNRITTPLLELVILVNILEFGPLTRISHQKEGLKFIMKGEAPLSPQSRTLWDLKSDHSVDQMLVFFNLDCQTRLFD